MFLDFGISVILIVYALPSWMHAAVMVDEMLAPTSISSASKSARGNTNGVDRLSSLCDELLHHVMSFLPMPEVVRTSLLSPRWRNLWASTPFIYIDPQDFRAENNLRFVDEDKLDKFGDHLLLLRDGAVSLDKARIFVAGGVTASVDLTSKEFHFPISKMVYGHRLLDGLSHATTLELHAPLHELAFERGLQTCSMFNNLTRLVLGDWCMAGDFYPLLRILQCSSKLKDLNLKLKMEECTFCMDSESSLSSKRGTPSGAGSYPCLERIKICCRKDDPRIGALVQVLLLIINPDRKISIKHC
ncbi:unnamed protein product [Alopecurus aequalis]